MCSLKEETTNHIFFCCNVVERVRHVRLVDVREQYIITKHNDHFQQFCLVT